MTPADLKAQHERALETLTHDQRLALTRLALARNAVRMNGGTVEDALARIFQIEAVDRALLASRHARVA